MAIGVLRMHAMDAIRVLGEIAVSIGDRRHHVLVQVQQPDPDDNSKELFFRLWDLDNHEVVQSFHGHLGRIHQVVAAVDDRRVFSASEDATLKEWDVATGTMVKTFGDGIAHTGAVCCLQVSSDGELVVSGSSDTTLKLWSVAKGTCLKTLTGHRKGVNCVDLSRDNCWIVSGSDDTTVRLWRSHNGRCIRSFRGHTGPVNCVAAGFNNHSIVSGSDDRTVRFWSSRQSKCLQTMQGHTGRITCIALSSDCQRVVSGSKDTTVCIWDAVQGKLMQTLERHTQSVVSVSLSSLQRVAFVWRQYVLSASLDNTSLLWDLATGNCVLARWGYPVHSKVEQATESLVQEPVKESDTPHSRTSMTSSRGSSCGTNTCTDSTASRRSNSFSAAVREEDGIVGGDVASIESLNDEEIVAGSLGSKQRPAYQHDSTQHLDLGEFEIQDSSSRKALNYRVTANWSAYRRNHGDELFVCCHPHDNKRCIVKTFSKAHQKRFARESKLLTQLHKNRFAGDYAVELIQVMDKTKHHSARCSSLVLQCGKQNLRQLLAGEEADELLDPPAHLVHRLARCVAFLHRMGLVHGGVQLDHFVNFGKEVPKIKLIGFGNSGESGEPMEFIQQLDPEYCPPELAKHLVLTANAGATSKPFVAQQSFDVWCFGILCLKMACKGKRLRELTPSDRDNDHSMVIWRTIASPAFHFDHSLAQMRNSAWPQPLIKNVVEKCLARDPSNRPVLAELIKRDELVPYHTMLDMQVHQVSQNFYLAQPQLPVFWAPVAWMDGKQPGKLKKFVMGCTKHLAFKSMELVLICEDAFEYLRDPNPVNHRCTPCEERRRLRIEDPTKFLKKCAPFLNCLALCFQLAGLMAPLVPKLNGIGDAGKCLGDVLDANSLKNATDSLGDQQLDQNDRIHQLHQQVQQLVKRAAQSDPGSWDYPTRQELVHSIHEQTKQIRREFLRKERQQDMLNVLRLIDKGRDWGKEFVIAGLTKVKVKNRPAVRWVCAHHAQSPVYSHVLSD